MASRFLLSGHISFLETPKMFLFRNVANPTSYKQRFPQLSHGLDYALRCFKDMSQDMIHQGWQELALQELKSPVFWSTPVHNFRRTAASQTWPVFPGAGILNHGLHVPLLLPTVCGSVSLLKVVFINKSSNFSLIFRPKRG